jgi:hypothetical protein
MPNTEDSMTLSNASAARFLKVHFYKRLFLFHCLLRKYQYKRANLYKLSIGHYIFSIAANSYSISNNRWRK